MKIKIFLILIIGILFVGIGFVSSQEEAVILTEATDIGPFMGLPEGQILGKGIEYELFNDKHRATFVNENSELSINGDVFTNIVPQGKAKLPTFIELDPNGIIVKADFTVNEEGGTYCFETDCVYASPNSRVLFDKEKGIIRIIPPDGTELSEMPNVKDFSLPNKYTTIIEGKNIKLPSGDVFSGKLNYEDGRAFVYLDDKTIINGVEIRESESKRYSSKLFQEVDVFFDGREHEGDYISFDLSNRNLILSSEGGKPVIVFKESNPFVKIDKGDNVGMLALPNSKIEIQNRDNEGLVPKITTSGFFVIDEDYKSIGFTSSRKRLNIRKFPSLFKGVEDSTTSPVEIVMVDSMNKPLFLEEHKIIVDNFNRILVVPDGFRSSTDFVALSEGIDVKFSSRIKYNYPTEETIEALTGVNLDFIGVSKANKDFVLGRLRDYWKTLTPETKNSMKNLAFANDEYFNIFFDKGRGEFVGAFAEVDKHIVFKGKPPIDPYSNIGFGLNVFRHEVAHQRHHELMREQNNVLLEDVERDLIVKLELQEQVSKKILQSKSDTERSILDKELGKIRKEYFKLWDNYKLIIKEGDIPFNTAWRNVVGDVSDNIYSKNPMAAEGSGPKSGFVRSYGTTSMFEDIATFVEEVVGYPKTFTKLINPQSPDYDIRYRQKLDLLYEHKFISYKEYSKVLEVAGVE